MRALTIRSLEPSMKTLVLGALLLAAPAQAKVRAQKPAASDAAPAEPKPAAPERSDAEIAKQAQNYLNSIDLPVTAAHWKQLGPRAEPVLLGVLRDPEEVPSRKARAVEGLAAIGTPSTPPLLHTLAGDEKQPVGVRLAAVRGLGSLLSEAELTRELQPLLEHAADPRVRSTAATVLARSAPTSSCAQVRAQAQRESLPNRAAFSRALDGCGAENRDERPR